MLRYHELIRLKYNKIIRFRLNFLKETFIFYFSLLRLKFKDKVAFVKTKKKGPQGPFKIYF